MKNQYTLLEKSTLEKIYDIVNNNDLISFDALELYYRLAHQVEENSKERTEKQVNYYHN